MYCSQEPEDFFSNAIKINKIAEKHEAIVEL